MNYKVILAWVAGGIFALVVETLQLGTLWAVMLGFLVGALVLYPLAKKD